MAKRDTEALISLVNWLQMTEGEAVHKYVITILGRYDPNLATWEELEAAVGKEDRAAVQKVRNAWEWWAMAMIEAVQGSDILPLPLKAYVAAREAANQAAVEISQRAYAKVLEETLRELQGRAQEGANHE